MIPFAIASYESNSVLPFLGARSLAADANRKQWSVTAPFRGGSFEQVYIQSLRTHPDTRQIAYVARQGGHHVAVRNQQVSAAYDAVWFESIHFTPQGDTLFYLAERGGKTIFVVNGIAQGAFAQVLDIQSYNPNPDGTAQGLDVFTLIQNQIIRLRALPFSN